jgi:predicted Zn-dependent peptidase
MQSEFNTTSPEYRIGTYRDESLFHRTKIENGVTLVTEKIPHVRSVAIGFWVQTGSRDEVPENNGISHLIEHMLFKGTSTRNAYEIAHAIENVGGVLNAFTSKDLTCYYAHILDEDLPLAVDLLSDILSDSLFLQQELDKEKNVIIDEIDDANEIPEEKIHDYFFQDLFESHPLGMPVLGSKKTVTALTRHAVLTYLREKYTRNRLIIAAAGNVEHESLCKMLETRFGSLDAHSRRIINRPLEIKSPARKNYSEASVLSHLCTGSRALPFSANRKYAALLLNTLLGGGMSSRLFQSVREKNGLCYNIYSYLEFFEDTGVFCIYTAADRAKLSLAIGLVDSELESLRRPHITEKELVSLKSQLKGNLMLGLEDTSSRMNRIAKMEIYLKKYYSLDDVIAGIESISLEDVESVAETLLNPDGFVPSILSPK